jgi:hypothetical protein
VSPASAIARIDALDNVSFSVPREVWLPVGSHTLAAHAEAHHGAEKQVILYGSDPVTASLELDPQEAAAPEKEPATVDFGEEEPYEETKGGDLPDVEHDNILPERFRKGGVSTRWWGGGESRLRFGIKAGAIRSQLVGEDAPDVGARVGISAFAYLGYRVADRISLQPEIGFVMKGAESSGLDYLTLPVLVAYSLALGPVETRLALGPELGVALTSDLDGRDVAALELSALASAAVQFPCGVVVELRYAHGLTTVDGDSGASEVSNSAASLLAGFTF